LASEFGPWEKGQTQRYRLRVEREKLVLEPELPLARISQSPRCPELIHKDPEHVEKAKHQGPHTVINTCLRTFASLIVTTMPLVVSWGTVVLIIANNTPLFQWVSAPFAWMLALVNIPEAVDVAPAFVLSYADQFLAAVIGANRNAAAAKFMCAGISATGLIYMTEVGVLILNSRIPLGVGKLTGIYKHPDLEPVAGGIPLLSAPGGDLTPFPDP
jgi:hypothetical protein